ncbi:MAG: Xaa-Pro dipeptidase [Pseudonocardiales bacterium]|nr:Xaa-Pro dipeptidase [Pseudonocardiales bacterium]
MTDLLALDSVPELSATEYETRVARLRERLAAAQLSVGIAYASPHLPGDIQYLTGYDPHLECGLLAVTQDEVVPMGGPEGEAMFADSGRLGTWRNLNSFEIPYQDYGDTKFWSLGEVLRDLLGEIPTLVGLISALDSIPASIYNELSDLGAQPVDVSEILRVLRYQKSPAELALFRRSSAIAGAAVRAMLDELRPGITELEVAAVGDSTMKALGAYSTGFDTMVCSGPRINTVIGRASERRIESGDMVLIGASPRFRGYASTVGRTVVAGSPTAEQAEFLNHAAVALSLSAEQLFVGNTANKIDLAARNYLATVGLDRFHMYGVGHGIGLSECLEEKTATAVSDYEIPTGISMMLDIGLFHHPTFHGSRHEDPYLVDQNGQVERLTDLPVAVFQR